MGIFDRFRRKKNEVIETPITYKYGDQSVTYFDNMFWQANEHGVLVALKGGVEYKGTKYTSIQKFKDVLKQDGIDLVLAPTTQDEKDKPVPQEEKVDENKQAMPWRKPRKYEEIYTLLQENNNDKLIVALTGGKDVTTPKGLAAMLTTVYTIGKEDHKLGRQLDRVVNKCAENAIIDEQRKDEKDPTGKDITIKVFQECVKIRMNALLNQYRRNEITHEQLNEGFNYIRQITQTFEKAYYIRTNEQVTAIQQETQKLQNNIKQNSTQLSELRTAQETTDKTIADFLGGANALLTGLSNAEQVQNDRLHNAYSEYVAVVAQSTEVTKELTDEQNKVDKEKDSADIDYFAELGN